MAGGRPAKPTALKILEGRAKARPSGEPRPSLGIPECPEWLMDDAKEEWGRVAPELFRLGLLARIDRTALAGYCQSYAKWKAAEEEISRKGMVFPVLGDDGMPKYYQQTPEVGIANQCLKQIRAFCSLFGLDPSSRAKMDLPSNKDDDDFASKLRSKIG